MNVQTHGLDIRQRGELVLAFLEGAGEVTVGHVSARAGASEMTIRRDLEALEREGALKRVHGGAISNDSRSYEPPSAIRAYRNVDNKGHADVEVVIA
jgi:DeoR/GlpR family transcriptional regulator of sugar metabolism